MSKFLMALIGLVFCAGLVMAADLTPASKEDAVKVNTAQTVTNGQAVTIGSGLTILTGSAEPLNGTNVVTLVAPGKAGVVAYVGIAGTSNLVGIADSGTAALAAAFEGNAGDVLHLISTASGTWNQVSKSAN